MADASSAEAKGGLSLEADASSAEAKGGLSLEAESLSTASLWKGDNDSDAEQMESYDSNPLANAGSWTEREAQEVYREKLLSLRSLYTSQLARLKNSLAERRRQFLLEWVSAGGDREEAVNPSRGGSLEDAAYRTYRRRSGEEAVLERRQKQRQIAASIEFFSRKEMRSSSRGHHQHLVRLQGQYVPTPRPICNNLNCDNKCLPFSTKCRRHICSDPKQLLYTSCTYIYPSGAQCGSPIPLYLSPTLCGGHCDTALSSPSPLEHPRVSDDTKPEELTSRTEGTTDPLTESSVTTSGGGSDSTSALGSLSAVRTSQTKLEGGGEGEQMEVVPGATTERESGTTQSGSGE